MTTHRALLALTLLVAQQAAAQRGTVLQGAILLNASTQFSLVNTRLQWVDYRGRAAVKLAPLAGHEADVNQEMAAILTATNFRDGVIEIDVSGARREGYSTTEDVSGFKGIVGLSFRVRGDTAERFYVRPENSPVNNQLFRNRSTQYEAGPDFAWDKLREQSPGVYESYAAIDPGAWTALRIEVNGTKARLFINHASQPALIVNDLKYGDRTGQIALWARVSTEAYFANLRITPTEQISSPATESLKFTEIINATTEQAAHLGRNAVHLTRSPAMDGKDSDMLAILGGEDFHDGTIELDVAGTPRPGSPPDSRGFIGVAFRVAAHADASEVIYLRPTNGRADDQLRRNHSVQYESDPDYPWHRLRSESPGVYESNVDLEPDSWTHMRIVVAGTTASLYVNGAAQPSLIVNDLKHGGSSGKIALWAHVDTDAWFSAVSISRQ